MLLRVIQQVIIRNIAELLSSDFQLLLVPRFFVHYLVAGFQQMKDLRGTLPIFL